MKRVVSLVAVLLLVIPAFAQTQTIAAVAASNPDLSTFLTLVAAADLVGVLNDPDVELTVFAPSNGAFDALPEEALATLLSDAALLNRVLTYHIAQGRFTTNDLGGMNALATMETDSPDGEPFGSELLITIGDETVELNRVAIRESNLEATNGIVHIVDSLILPPDIAEMLGLAEPDRLIYGSLNPAGVENDLLYLADSQFASDTLVPLGNVGAFGIESIGLDSVGNAYVTVDIETNADGAIVAGGIVRFDDFVSTETVGEGVLIAGEATGIVSPKGLQVLETLGVVAIADVGAQNIKLFSLDAAGDVAPVATISLGEGGSVWDIWYDILNDTLYAAKTNGELVAYDSFSGSLGADGPDRVIVPTDADGNKISVNLHGIDVDYDSNTVILSDVGDAAVNTDGQIFLLIAASISDGPTPVDGRIFGDQTQLGNPVDLIFDSFGIYVAEKANDKVLYFASILDVTGEVNLAPEIAAVATKAESVAVYPTRESQIISDMGLLDE